ncbi:MAG: modulator of FtsH protease [Gammaproteobacteria bacterium]|jgi:modulator of FtsH protease
MQLNTAVTQPQESILETNKVLRNTYLLLSMTLLFSGLMAFVSIVSQASQMAAMISLFGSFGLIWLVLPKTANSATGIPVLFLITGLLGFALGPMLSLYLSVRPDIVMIALGGTGTIFLGLSGYALTTRKDFSFMAGFLIVGVLVAFMAIIANIFLQLPVLSLAISSAVILIMSGMILFRTSAIIHGGETNYIMAAADLFLSIFNIFVHLLSILGIMGSDD